MSLQQHSKLTTEELYEWMNKIKDVIEINRQFIEPTTEIIDNFLFLGDWNDSTYKNIKRNGITYVLNCCGSDHKYCNQIKEHKIMASDQIDYDIIKNHKDECISFIDECKNNNEKILIHCMGGINRSVTMTIIYLIHYYKDYSLLKAIEHIAKRRCGILNNQGFQKQLVEYSYSINKLYGYIPNYITNKSEGNKAIEITKWENDSDDDDDDVDDYESKINQYETDRIESVSGFCRNIVLAIINENVFN
eukprot:141618_1